MKFKINPKIFKDYPELAEAVVILKNIDNTVDGREILKLLRTEEKKIQKGFVGKELSEHPQIKPWREAFRKFGSKPNKYSSSVEALLKRVIKGQELPDINPLVNLYNYCSIKHTLPFGGEDFIGVFGNMELKHCTGDEEFIPIMSKEIEPPDKGEISWCDAKGVTCRKWNWRQCDRTKVTEKTKEGYFIIDGLPPVTKKQLKKAAKDFIKLSKKYLNADGEVYWLDKSSPEVEIDIETQDRSSLIAHRPSLGSKSVKRKALSGKRISAPLENTLPFEDFVDENSIQSQLAEIIWKAVKKAGYDKHIGESQITVQHPQNEVFGDYSTSTALQIAKKIGVTTNYEKTQIAKRIIKAIGNQPLLVSKGQINGFINLDLDYNWLISQVDNILNQEETYGIAHKKQDKRIIVEFGQPNTHKMPHIGHLFSYCLGESFARLIQSLGFQIFRANYQGDIGPHVAKCIWAYLKQKPKVPKTSRGKADLLQQMYQKGSAAYKESKQAKKEIDEINKKIYQKDKKLTKVWKETRDWSVNFYKEFEKKLGVHYDRYYFESEVFELGEKIVKENIGKVFKESKGAIIFEGSKYGLHDRVFITKRGTPTYEAKDMGLQSLKYKEWPFDFMLMTTASEQNEYFKVMIKAVEEMYPKLAGKMRHIGFGMIRLKSGKMSSRTGDIVTGVGLIDKAIEEVKKIMKERDLQERERNKIAEVVGIGAVKYSFLKSNPLQDSIFDFKESISFEGNAGPYLQYTYARAKSILREAKSQSAIRNPQSAKFNDEEVAILRTLYKFPEIVIDAAKNLAPNLICNYLFDLAQKFNLFYKKHQVLKATSDEQRTVRLALTAATAQVIKNGLYLLGIDTLERM